MRGMRQRPAMPRGRVADLFTLVELLVVIAIIITLGAVSMTAYLRAKSKGDNSAAVKNMENIGTAMSNYTADHLNHLPVFKDTLVSPAYSTMEPYTQASVLQPYLKLPNPTSKTQYAEVFHPPGLKGDLMGGHKNWYDLTCFAMYNADYFATTKTYLPKDALKDSDDKEVGPFGHIADSDSQTTEDQTIDHLNSALKVFSDSHNNRSADLSMVPAMLEINAKYPKKGGWSGPVPKKPLYGNTINVLYFDWHVGPVDANYFYVE